MKACNIMPPVAPVKEQPALVIDAVPAGILAVNTQGLIIFANPFAQQLIGMPGAHLLGRQVQEVIPSSLLPQILKSGKSLFGQKVTFQNAVVMANYSPVISDHRVVGAVSVFQDIAILEQTSAELNYVKGLMRELEAIISCSYDGIFVTDGQGIALRVNKSYERIAGIKAEEVIGKSMKKLVEEHYYDQSVALMVINRRERVTISQTVKGKCQNLVTGNPVFDEQGNLIRVVTNVRDITDLVNLQNQLDETKRQALKYATELSHLRSLQMEENKIIYCSAAMEKVITIAKKIAEVNTTVLITGESGTGKELITKLIHKAGKGIDKPFIKINCAAVPEQLLESELFGYESGAFTGAKKEGKPGLFELAHNGTLLLDEVGDLPLALQAKLLRAIQDKEIMRVGGTKPIAVNVRIIAASHQDIAKMMREGGFRQDLFYRLMVIPIELAPLRDRKEDIPLLIAHFVEKYNRLYAYNKSVDAKLVDKLVDYSWPGNVRELENIIERIMVTSEDDRLTMGHLPEIFCTKAFLPKPGTKLKAAVEDAETYLLAEAYQECQCWHKVAQKLEIDRATVYRKAKRYGLLKCRTNATIS